MPGLSYQETMQNSSPLVTEFLLPADAAGRLYELAQGDLEVARKLATLWDESNLRPDVFVRLVAELAPLPLDGRTPTTPRTTSMTRTRAVSRSGWRTKWRSTCAR
jgi:hypothetical protein